MYNLQRRSWLTVLRPTYIGACGAIRRRWNIPPGCS